MHKRFLVALLAVVLAGVLIPAVVGALSPAVAKGFRSADTTVTIVAVVPDSIKSEPDRKTGGASSTPENKGIFRGPYYSIESDSSVALRLRRSRHLAEQGNSAAQDSLGMMYANGEGVPQNDAEAVKWLRLAAAQGYAKAQANLGFMYANGRGVPQDYAEAVKWLLLAAAQGDAKDQFSLGMAYSKGQGVPQNDAEAVKWFRKATEQGYAHAQYNLGVMYDNGRGVPQDYAEAVKWFRLAAAQGLAVAQGVLGVMYASGRGVPQNDAEAVKWYRKAADQGFAEAQNKLGGMYFARYIEAYNSPASVLRRMSVALIADQHLKSRILPMEYPELDEAVKWYSKAAEQGLDIAQLPLGEMYEEGLAGPIHEHQPGPLIEA